MIASEDVIDVLELEMEKDNTNLQNNEFFKMVSSHFPDGKWEIIHDPCPTSTKEYFVTYIRKKYPECRDGALRQFRSEFDWKGTMPKEHWDADKRREWLKTKFPNPKYCFSTRCIECSIDILGNERLGCGDTDCFFEFVCHTESCPELKITAVYRTSIGKLTEGERDDFEIFLADGVPINDDDGWKSHPSGVSLVGYKPEYVRLDDHYFTCEQFVLCSGEDIPKDKRSQNKHKTLLNRYDKELTKDRISKDTYKYRAIWFMQEYKKLADKIRQGDYGASEF